MKLNRLLILFFSLLITTAYAQQKQVRPVGAADLVQQTTTSVHIHKQDLYTTVVRNLTNAALPEVQLLHPQLETIFHPLCDTGLVWPEQLKADVELAIERKQAKAIIRIPRYIRLADGRVQKVAQYDIEVQEQKQAAHKTSGSRVYAAHSVLASGTFYKLAISHQGLYKIDYNFIKNTLGIEPSAIQPANIRLYGNGGEMLAEDNAVVPADDLTENAIEVVDGGDGQFNPGDYILFYANGPHSILKDSLNNGFTHAFNIYSEVACYFLNFDLGPGKRVSVYNNPSSSNVNADGYNGFQFFEKDSSNPGKFGKTWWGDEFSEQPGRYLVRNYSFSIPSVQNTTALKVRTRLGAIGYSGNSSFQVKANGQVLHSAVLPSVGTTYADPVSQSADQSSSINLSTNALTVQIQFTPGNINTAGYLDFIEVNSRNNLVCNGYLHFADWNTVSPGNIAHFQLQQANAATEIWDVTNPLLPQRMNATFTNPVLSFNNQADYLHTYIAFDGTVTDKPSYVEKCVSQDLHAIQATDYIVITDPALYDDALRLAEHHKQKRGWRYVLVTPAQIYNEFSSGTQDVSAIRNFLKMYYDRLAVADMPRFVLLFGDASYDYKSRIKNNTNLVPTYETYESDDKIFGYCTDDYFGFLDDSENINNFNSAQINTLDIGIGRIPASTASVASAIVSKILNYDSPSSFGPWKNTMTFNADDQDYNIHLQDAEIMSQYATDSLRVYNDYKIYVDGFVQQSTPAGPRSPDANKAVDAQLYNGTFLMNYNGHGGPLGWCEERIFSMDDINLMTNYNKLPLFITATCDFAPFDDPAVLSAGEILLEKADGGAIALMATTRLVYQDQNREMNLNYMESGFKAMSNGHYPTLGEAYTLSKNLKYINHVSTFEAANFRKFALLGDPGLPLAFPIHVLKTDSINGMAVSVAYDTLKALGKYRISGHIEDRNGTLLNGFNGTVYPVVFDKPKKLTTLQNDPDSYKQDYYVQNNALYKGKASIHNGRFSFTFVVPKDINYEIDRGKISYYADNGTEDASGFDKGVYIGGSSPNAGNDQTGPVIRAYLNDGHFVNGGITPPDATLILHLSDDNGINYTGNSIGHDITAILDGNAQNTYVLNNFFEADLDQYASGSVHFPLHNLSEGPHYLKIKAWDLSNNSSEARLDFVVVNTNKTLLSHVYNYPNPFTQHTRFMFEHNRPGQNLYVTLTVFTVSGKAVKNLHAVVNTEGTRSEELEWDGRDEYGDKLGKGVYIYKLLVKTASGESESQYQKLILLD